MFERKQNEKGRRRCVVAMLSALAVFGVARSSRAGETFLQASVGSGYTTYDKHVEGGYLVNGIPYDVSYSGFTYVVDAGGGYFFTPRWGIGAELGYLGIPSPLGKGTSQGGGSTIEDDDADAGAFGYGVALLAFRPVMPLRLSALVGYAGGSADGGFGGTGPVYGVSGDYGFVVRNGTSVAIGAEFDYIALSDPEHPVGNAVKLAEHGPMLSARLRVSLVLNFLGD